jgi:cyclopropane-fatty-acyl-phospholipid synthase
MNLYRKFLQGYVRTGTLTVQDIEGDTRSYGVGPPFVTIRIHDSRWPTKLLLNPALAVGEGYTSGAYTLESGDLTGLMELSIKNTRWGRDHWLLGAMSQLATDARWLYQYNPVRRSRANVAQHYEFSIEFFDLFLDSQRQYSCAYFMDEQDDLEKAQQQKLRHIASKLRLEPGMTVLDIGCGWGGLAIYLAQHCGVRVTGITLAKEQWQFAEQQAEKAGVADRVKFLLLDYRQVEKQFDRIISVGMFEHVGLAQYKRFFAQVRQFLAPDGVALLHFIGRADGPGATNAWTRKYIFPGGYSPALSEVVPVIERTQLYVTDVEVLRLHYARTLQCWLQRCTERREEIRQMFDERFCRIWEFYLNSAMASFRWGSLVVFQIQMARNINTVPITRDYALTRERELAASAMRNKPVTPINASRNSC